MRPNKPPRQCYDCGLDYPFPGLDLLLPHDQWKRIFPEFDGDGLLCPNCISIRAAELGDGWCLRAIVEGMETIHPGIDVPKKLFQSHVPKPFDEVADEEL